MDFKTVLEEKHAKETTSLIVDYIGNSPTKFNQLIQVFNKGPKVVTQRAAWPISYIGQEHPKLLIPYYDLFIKLLKQPGKHNAINRNILRALQTADIPEEHQGSLLDVCFHLLNTQEEPIAVKSFSMSIIYNLSKTYPDIIPELKASIENVLPNASSGIKAKAYKILNDIK